MTRVNEKIRAPKIRVVYGEGQQLGVMTPHEALAKAKSVGLDLVEIAAKADPPVCRIVDYGKYKYEQSKLKKTSKSKGPIKMKEVKFRVRTEEHDYNIKCAFSMRETRFGFSFSSVVVKMPTVKSALSSCRR